MEYLLLDNLSWCRRKILLSKIIKGFIGYDYTSRTHAALLHFAVAGTFIMDLVRDDGEIPKRRIGPRKLNFIEMI